MWMLILKGLDSYYRWGGINYKAYDVKESNIGLNGVIMKIWEGG